MTADEVAEFERVMGAGGVAVFPADTVYGLATHPGSEDGVARIYRMKGRPPERPSAVMFFSLEGALDALPELGERTRAAVRRLLPGGVTLLLPNPQRRWPLACGPSPERLGVRVPRLGGALAPLATVRGPVLQTSANPSGGPDARRASDVDQGIRAAADLVLDAGELPGTPSTVVDLSSYEHDGSHAILREGAVAVAEVSASLDAASSAEETRP